MVILPADKAAKKEAINTLIDMLPAKVKIKDIEELRKDIFYREKLMSTGIGLGIGIPHVRFTGIGDPVIAVGIQPKGIKDYQSMDGKPVRIIILIIVEKLQHKMHIKLLGQIMQKLKTDQTIEKLAKAKNTAEIKKILAG